jgi:hypothetical protein
MSQVVSLRLKDNQMDRLRKVARRMGRTPTEVGALLVEEGLREAEFACVEFRDSAVGRQAYVKGSGLAVWEVVTVAQDYNLDVAKTAEHLEWPLFKVQAALNYAAAFYDEINDAIADNDSYDFETLQRLLPQAEEFVVSAEPAADALATPKASE